MFGDNKTIADNVMTPRSEIHKRHGEFSFHLTREAIAAKIMNCLCIDGNIDPDDVLTKQWAHHDTCHTLKPIFFWPGDTWSASHSVQLPA